MKCDLHCHSQYSFDSKLTIEEILKKAKAAEISVLAITDHNDVRGSLEALKQSEIEIIPGVEIDCFCKDTVIHLLAYGMELTDPRFEDLRISYQQELGRIGEIRLAKIEEKYQCKLNIAKIKSYTHLDNPYTNVEIERVLFEDGTHPDLYPYQKGDKSSNPIANFYWDHLAIHKWGYVEMKLPDYQEIIEWIHSCKGVVVCAHPKVTVKREIDKIEALLAAGIDGFEVYCSYHDKEDSDFYNEIVQKHHLLGTCGSDFHGITKPNIQLGETRFDADCSQLVDLLKLRIKEKHD